MFGIIYCYVIALTVLLDNSFTNVTSYYACPLIFFLILIVGVLYRDAGSISLAIEAYEQCLKIDPDSRNAGQVLSLSLCEFYLVISVCYA